MKRTSEATPPAAKKSKTGSKVAIFGGPGAFTHAAADEYFDKGCAFTHLPSAAEVFEAVEAGTVQYGIVPAETSGGGSIRVVSELLAKHKLFIVGEHATQDDPCLLGLEGTDIKTVKSVLSHPNVLRNCSSALASLKADIIAISTTSAACQKVRDGGDKTVCAVGSHRAAAIYGLQVLKEHIANEMHPFTRYIILGTAPAEFATRLLMDKRKHSLALIVLNEPSSIFRMLSPFAFRNINILRLESKPASVANEWFADGAKHWEYVHFVDFEPSVDPKKNEGLLRDLEEYCKTVRDFGCYMKWEPPIDDKANYENYVKQIQDLCR